MEKKLENTTIVFVKFSEADSLSIVWHGHYIRYFEDGREAFGREYGLGYLDVFNNGFVTPIVTAHCDYKWPLRYGDSVKIVSEFVPCEAAKIRFNFTIYNAQTDQVVATGYTIQVFLDKKDFMLQLSNPPFFEKWKQQHGMN